MPTTTRKSPAKKTKTQAPDELVRGAENSTPAEEKAAETKTSETKTEQVPEQQLNASVQDGYYLINGVRIARLIGLNMEEGFEKQIPAKKQDTDATVAINAINDVTIQPGGRALMSTGLKLMMPNASVDTTTNPKEEVQFFGAMVTPRFSLAVNAVLMLNGPMVISNYNHDEIKIVLMNLGNEPFVIKAGDPIANLTFLKLPCIALIPVKLEEK